MTLAVRPADGGNVDTWATPLNDWLDQFATAVPSDYSVLMRGSTAVAMSLNPANPDFSGTDPAAVLQSAITQLGAGGGTITLVGALSWGSVPKLPQALTAKLHIRGIATTVVTLTSAAPRLFDFAASVTGDTFQDIEISDLLVDANNTTGKHHVIVGTFVAGATRTNINMARIAVRRIKVINVYTDPAGLGTTNRIGIWLVVGRNVAGQNTLKDIVVEDVRLEGGASGIIVAGQNPGANTPAYIDGVVFARCWHDTFLDSNLVGASNGFQVGGYATGRRIHVVDCYGNRCGDAGIEINIADTLVERTTVENAMTANFFHTIFAAPTSANENAIVYHKCVASATDPGCGSGVSHGWSISGAGTLLGTHHVKIIDCEYTKDLSIQAASTGFTFTGGAIYRREGVTPTGAPLQILEVERLKATFINGTWNSASSASYSPITISTLAANTGVSLCRFKDIQIISTATKAGAGALGWSDFEVNGGGIYLDIDGLETTSNFTSFLNQQHKIIRIGSTATTLLGLRVRRVNALVEGAPQTAAVSLAGGSIAFAKPPGHILDCDLQNLTTGFEIIHTTAGMEPKVKYQNIKWATFPKASVAMGATNFLAATFTTAVGNQYIGGSDADIHFATGTGAAITAIATSKDGSTYEQVYAQGSGAMAQDFVTPVENGDYVKVTFATTQPTTRVRFRR